MAKNKARTILTPLLDGELIDLADEAQPLTYLKRILPLGEITYSGVKYTFDQPYLVSLANAFNEKALDTTPFVLADPGTNGHTMDPERWRGEVIDMSYQAAGPDGPGLYSKIRFPNEEAAKAVQLSNGKLGVSARIQHGLKRVDGKSWPQAIIHVLGTMHQRVPKLGNWRTVDLSGYNSPHTVIDLSSETFKEIQMAKAKGKQTVAEAFEGLDLSDPAVVEKILQDALDAGQIDLSTDLDDETDDTLGGEFAPIDPALQARLDLSESRASDAEARANRALAIAAQKQWDVDKASRWDSLPPAMLDLAEPILNAADETTLDLSDDGGTVINVSDTLRKILDLAKGYVDLSDELGHGGDALDLSDSAADDALIAQFNQLVG